MTTVLFSWARVLLLGFWASGLGTFFGVVEPMHDQQGEGLGNTRLA